MKVNAITLGIAGSIWMAGSVAADPSLECSQTATNQAEIGGCVAAQLTAVNGAVSLAYSFAETAAKNLDAVTGRAVALPALQASQAAWAAYRDRQCEYVGTTFGGGSGTGIAIDSCQVRLGRARVEALMALAR